PDLRGSIVENASQSICTHADCSGVKEYVLPSYQRTQRKSGLCRAPGSATSASFGMFPLVAIGTPSVSPLSRRIVSSTCYGNTLSLPRRYGTRVGAQQRRGAPVSGKQVGWTGCVLRLRQGGVSLPQKMRRANAASDIKQLIYVLLPHPNFAAILAAR